jgi:hypothetical protein
MTNGSDFVTFFTGKETLFSITIRSAEHHGNNSYLARFHRSTSFTINFFFLMVGCMAYACLIEPKGMKFGWTYDEKDCLERCLDDFGCSDLQALTFGGSVVDQNGTLMIGNV